MSLKLPTEVEKKFLALFDEPTPTKSHDTKRQSERRKEFETRFGARKETSEIVASPTFAAERITWIPCSYVLFSRQTTCKHCHATERGMDSPRLFLQQRKSRRDDSNPYLYTPCAGIDDWSLPRRVILNIATTPYCLNCFEGTEILAKVVEIRTTTETDFGTPCEERNFAQMGEGK